MVAEKVEYWVCEKCSSYPCFLTSYVDDRSEIRIVPDECPYGDDIPDEPDWKQIDKKTFDYMVEKKNEALREADERRYR